MGKTFLGVSIAKVLLASRGISSQIPILVVYLTNHALDSFLEDLRNAGIENFVPFGGQSKEAWTQKYEVKNIVGRKKKSAIQRSMMKEAHLQCEGTLSDIHCFRLSLTC